MYALKQITCNYYGELYNIVFYKDTQQAHFF